MGTDILYQERAAAVEKESQAWPVHLMILVALCVDLFTPYLIWKDILPAELRWISHAAVAVMLIGAIARMIVYDHLPTGFWLIVGIAMIWSVVAILQGQGITATAWGLWRRLEFAFVGLFVYLGTRRSHRFAGFLLTAGLILLALQVSVQLLQFTSGQPVGDNLAGLFGQNGTGNAVFFVLLVNCLFLGHWIITRRWIGLVCSLVLGSIVTVLGEVKLYPFVVGVLTLLALVISAIRSHSIGKFLKYTLLFITVIGVIVAYMQLYNSLVPSANRRPIQAFITDPQMLMDYLNQSNRVYSNGNYRTNMGRNYALSVGWNSIQADPVTFLFGYGIGARGESKTLQTTGIGFDSADAGVTVGSSLLVFMTEMGVVGLAVLACLYALIVIVLIKDIRQQPDSPVVELRYALLLFSVFWPIWFWYANVWNMRVPMLIYWMILGYVMAEARQPLKKIHFDDSEKAR